MNRPALLIAGHGTRDPAGAAEFAALVERVRALAGFPVAGGFIELSPPPISVAVADLVAQEATDVVVVPLMLLAAGHTKNDIPAAIVRERLTHPAVRFRYGRDLGVHPTILELLRARLGEAVASEFEPETTVLLVGRGSSDPEANADVFKVARFLHEGSAFPSVEVCYSGVTGPSIADGLERCHKLGARRIVVLPYFLFTGVLVRRIQDTSEAFAVRTGIEVRVPRHLGPDERLAGLVLERYEEALSGDPRMNCDVCVHRVALPGFERKVGMPAVPHFHPDEDGHRHLDNDDGHAQAGGGQHHDGGHYHPHEHVSGRR